MAAERRKHARAGEIDVEVQVEGQAARRARTQNVSRGGAFILTDDPAEQGTRLRVRLFVDGKSLDVEAEVRWTSRFRAAPGMGVQFLGDPQTIHEFLGLLSS